MIFVTGSAGFIGSNFVLDWFKISNEPILSIDKLTYASCIKNLESLEENVSHTFVKVDIGDSNQIEKLLKKYKPKAIINFAAESHVDRSIEGPREFINTNIVGTFNLLESTLKYWQDLAEDKRNNFRFLHVSTDEVYGSLKLMDRSFTEENPYRPNSPYSASKASSDHLVRSYFHTYKLPSIITNCSNNYGPFQFPEKLIPNTINCALNNKKIPIYGNGKQIRDWLYVEDHCSALREVLKNGIIGEVYNIGGECEKANIDVVNQICTVLDDLYPKNSGNSYKDQITFVEDRLGHDFRYAIDTSKIKAQLDWGLSENFDSGIKKTIQWYLDNKEWVKLTLKNQ